MRNTMPYPTRPTGCYPPVQQRGQDTQVLAMAYVPWQEWQSLYDAEKGFACGTLFQELNKPFRGMGGCCQ